MKKIIYFILALLSLACIACVGYVGLADAFSSLPTIEIVSYIGMPLALGATLSFWGAIPLIVLAAFAFVNFFDRNIKLLFFIITILVIALDIIVLYFPSLLGA